MKAIGAALVISAVASVAFAATMRPSVIVYGQVRDAYGIRLASGEQISAFKGTNEAGRTYAVASPDGMSYHLSMDVYDPSTAASNQVQPGDAVQMKVKIGANFQPTIGTNGFAAPGNGAPVRVDLVIGTDSDGDGLPDAWEQMAVANSGGGATNINQVGPGRDLDGDGMPDDQEFWYGSFAFLAGDELRITTFDPDSGRYRFSFLTVGGVAYAVEQTTNLLSGVWSPTPTALSAGGALATGDFTGTGDFMDVYIGAATNVTYHYRLHAK